MFLSLSRLLLLLQILGFADAAEGNVGKYLKPIAGTDFRTPCPMLNTLMNHGYLPRNGSVPIKKTELATVFQNVVGFPQSIMATFLDALPLLDVGSHGDDSISLVQVSIIGKIEHPASLVRGDHWDGDYIRPNKKLLKKLYGMSKNGKDITLVEFSQFRALRFSDCHQDSPTQCHISIIHHASAILEAALVVATLGDENWSMSLDDVKSFLELEQFPKHWKAKTTYDPLSLLGLQLRIKIYSWIPFDLLKPVVKSIEQLYYRLLKSVA